MRKESKVIWLGEPFQIAGSSPGFLNARGRRDPRTPDVSANKHKRGKVLTYFFACLAFFFFTDLLQGENDIFC